MSDFPDWSSAVVEYGDADALRRRRNSFEMGSTLAAFAIGCVFVDGQVFIGTHAYDWHACFFPVRMRAVENPAFS
ncbi:MAG: hypothetical protein Q7R47_06480 [Candidatus Diapherotrites archaeon]|nr:hypothetical protein [Candidatus Diapherotrites archaeon]